MGLEIVKQIPDLDACIIPIGGGGLIAGSAVAVKFLAPKCKIIVSLQVYFEYKKKIFHLPFEEFKFFFLFRMNICT